MSEYSKQTGIIWLTRNGFSFFSSINNSVLTLSFPSDVIKYLEFVD